MEQNKSTKNHIEIDIRDIARYLLGKIWIIAVAAICLSIAAFFYTNYGVTEMYSSTTEMFILDQSGTNTTTNNWNVGQNITYASSNIVEGDFCEAVANHLNNEEFSYNNGEYSSEEGAILKNFLGKTSNYNFKAYFAGVLGGKSITADQIRSYISVNANEDSPIISVTATTPNKELSCVISNAVLYYYKDYVRDVVIPMYNAANEPVTNTNISAIIHSTGKVPTSPSNINLVQSIILGFIIGAVIACAVLVIVFIFDDKIKTPDDVQKRLGLNVLGAIPEID